MLGYVNWHRGRKLRASARDPRPSDPRSRRAEAGPHRGDRRSRQSRAPRGIPARGGMAAPSRAAEPRDGDPRQSRRLCQAASRAGHQALAALHAVEQCRRIAGADAADPVSLRAALRRRRHRGAVLRRPDHAVRRRGQDRHAPARPARRGLGAARARGPVPRRADPPPSASRSGELAPRASRRRPHDASDQAERRRARAAWSRPPSRPCTRSRR